MMMWEHRNVTLAQYLTHIWRLVSTRDVVWDWCDLIPSLASPFLLTSYYVMCKRRGLTLPEMFQWDLIWEPEGEQQLRRVRSMMDDEGKKDDEGRERGPRFNKCRTALGTRNRSAVPVWDTDFTLNPDDSFDRIPVANTNGDRCAATIKGNVD
jgi:hypothetical protein